MWLEVNHNIRLRVLQMLEGFSVCFAHHQEERETCVTSQLCVR
jgi:hypothetical protein